MDLQAENDPKGPADALNLTLVIYHANQNFYHMLVPLIP